MGSGVLLLAALASLLALTVCYSVASVRARRLSDQRASLLEEVGLLQEVPNIADSSELFRGMVVSDDFTEFLTLPAYEFLD